MADYCDKTHIEPLIQLEINSASKPSLSAVLIFISQKTAEINILLKSVGFQLPITDTDFLLLLQEKTAFGVAGTIVQTYGKNYNSVESGQGNYYLKIYNDFIKDLNDNPDKYLAIISAEKGFYVGNQVSDGVNIEITEPEY